MFIIEFSYNFLYVWSCMKLYEKKFPIYENCMINIFGQPGTSDQGSTDAFGTRTCEKLSSLLDRSYQSSFILQDALDLVNSIDEWLKECNLH